MIPAPEALAAALADRYRIERQLGVGGMATVYLAEDLKHDRHVAIKVLKPELAAVLGAERFVQEIKTTAALSHPHILPLFDSGQAGGFLYYVMPYIQGETIRDKLNRETQFGIEESIQIATEVADALDYAHRHGVIHRDIKPENILLHDGRPMVADFGIALAVSAAAGGRMTETGLSLGTPHYMSPEQATAEKEITARSDVYSIASVLYEMLAGQPPHLGGSAQQIIMKIIAEPVAMVTQFRKTVPPHVAAALATALEKLPADRFASAAEFRDALRNPAFATTHGIGFAAGTSGVGTQGLRRRYYVALAVAAVASVAALAGWFRPEPAPEVSRHSLFLPDSQGLSTANGTLVAISPDGRTIAYVTGNAPTTQLLVRSLDELRPRVLSGSEGAINPSFSPDGKRIAFITIREPRAVKVMPVAGGPAVTLTDSLVDLGGLAWGDDGYIYYDGKLEGDGVARIRENGGAPPEIASRPDSGESYHFLPSALPDGRGFLFTIRRSGSESDIGVMDARTGTKRVLARGFVGRYSPSGHLLVVTDDGTLFATPMDLEKLELKGEAVPMAEGLLVRGNQRVDLVISRSGSALYTAGATASGARELIWIDRTGGKTAVDPSYSASLAGRPQISPDGGSVAVAIGTVGARQVWVKQLDAGPASRVSDLGAFPTWYPDGRRIAFSTGRSLFQVPADGSTPATEIVGEEEAFAPTISSDGRWIVYAKRGDIWAIRPGEDSLPRRIVNDAGQQTLPALSPDGKWLAYSSDETGSWHVIVRPFPETATAKRQVSVRVGYAPLWSRSGRELFFVTPDSLYVADVSTGAAFRSGIPKPLFSVTGLPVSVFLFDVSPDARRFLLVRYVGSAPGENADELVLVQNFAAELKAKSPR